MSLETEREEVQITALLAPLSNLAPASRRRRTFSFRTRRLIPVWVGALALAGSAAAAATVVFGPLHDVDATPDPSPLTCAGLIGKPGNVAADYLSARGYEVTWRYQTFSGTALRQPSGTTPGAVEGHSAVVSSPPSGSIVSNLGILPGEPHTVVVFIQAADDPNAPQTRAPSC